MRLFLLFWVLVLASLVNVPLAGAAGIGDGDGKEKFIFDGWAGPALTVYATKPAALSPDRPIVFVMHGTRRNADDYRDQWHDLALANNFLLVVPEFPRSLFPGVEGYNFGNTISATGEAVPEEKWVFSAIEPIFDAVRERFAMQTAGYALYGHSAGSQFVHRFVMYTPDARVAQIVSANAGTYMMPDLDIRFPYGLNKSGVNDTRLAKAFALPVTILLGDRDIDPNHKSLPRGPEAKAQGPNRLARGFAFFEAGRVAAKRLGVPFNWHLTTVRGADHNNVLMAPAAMPYLLLDAN